MTQTVAAVHIHAKGSIQRCNAKGRQSELIIRRCAGVYLTFRRIEASGAEHYWVLVPTADTHLDPSRGYNQAEHPDL